MHFSAIKAHIRRWKWFLDAAEFLQKIWPNECIFTICNVGNAYLTYAAWEWVDIFVTHVAYIENCPQIIHLSKLYLWSYPVFSIILVWTELLSAYHWPTDQSLHGTQYPAHQLRFGSSSSRYITLLSCGSRFANGVGRADCTAKTQNRFTDIYIYIYGIWYLVSSKEKDVFYHKTNIYIYIYLDEMIIIMAIFFLFASFRKSW